LVRQDKEAAEISALASKRDAHDRARRAAAERLRELRGQAPPSTKLLREQVRALRKQGCLVGPSPDGSASASISRQWKPK
jgi:hypothetical protein